MATEHDGHEPGYTAYHTATIPRYTTKFFILRDGGANSKVARAHTNDPWASGIFFSYEPIGVLSCIWRCLTSGGPSSRPEVTNCVAEETRFVGNAEHKSDLFSALAH